MRQINQPQVKFEEHHQTKRTMTKPTILKGHRYQVTNRVLVLHKYLKSPERR